MLTYSQCRVSYALVNLVVRHVRMMFIVAIIPPDCEVSNGRVDISSEYGPNPALVAA